MILRASIGFQLDSAFPRDRVHINPHYYGDNAQAIADVLKANIKAKPGWPLVPFTIKVYDAEKAAPSFPLAQAVEGTGFASTTQPRELGMCLSYYSTWNRPRYRGRLYIPSCFLSGGVGIRPSAGQVAQVLGYHTVFTQNLPAQHNMVVYSRVDKKANGVTDFWVDDEWDVVRSRGLRGETRQTVHI